MENNQIYYKMASEQLLKGKPLFSKVDALAPMLEHIINVSIEGDIYASFQKNSSVKAIGVTEIYPSKYSYITVR